MSARRLLIPILLPAALIVGIAGVLFLTTPKSEDFWWTDGASFALNGALVHDYLVSGFHQSPMAFANEWFRHYPAVTISMYPPIFPVAEAFAFSLFGFSHAVAQATVAAFAGLAVFGAYRLARTAMGRAEAGGGVLLLFAAPGILLWSRQVMMELPSLAFLLLAGGCFLGYQASRRSVDLALTTLLLLAAVYTKQTAIFAVPAFAIALIATERWQGLRDKRVLLAAAAGVIGRDAGYRARQGNGRRVRWRFAGRRPSGPGRRLRSRFARGRWLAACGRFSGLCRRYLGPGMAGTGGKTPGGAHACVVRMWLCFRVLHRTF
jgi:4-amino-4-deoxy-L-arabinose transferase-like glycosyltransferase